MIYLKLYAIFFTTGLFTFGGGLASLPILQDFLVEGGWISQHEFVDMIAVSQSTPGPIGINLASYIGYTVGSFPGAVIASFGLLTPAYIISIIIIRSITSYSENRYVNAVMKRIRPAVIGLVGAAVFFIASNALAGPIAESGDILNLRCLILFALFALLRFFRKLHPAVFIILGAMAGIAFL
ncbi:chromate transporter [Sedimentisphaera salicampi]|uniref:chromate transporter n=1 Tax=Sedimentisphaera salicampi TaxID=1941349 RepID=UPI000B9A298C|nr:chromate transporter [Sedimentisphaera salicampi]OXU14796.1 putative chromate transport protein [Sedimentisphaera salicampi]